MEKNTRRYRARIFFTQVVSGVVLLFGIAAVVAYVDPLRIGIPADQFRLYSGQPIWLLTGIFFIALGVSFLVMAWRRSRRALWVVAHISPIEMLLTLEVQEDSDSTTYYALLRNMQDARPRWRAWVDPTFRVAPLVGIEVPARVFVDPKTGSPAAVQVDSGVLWANPFQGADIESGPKVSGGAVAR